MIKNMENQAVKDKTSLRKYIKDKKKSMSEDEIASYSSQITTRLIALKEYKEVQRIYAYASYNQEVRTRQLIEYAIADGKLVLVPKVYGDIMKFHYIDSYDELVCGAYGIPEPDNDRIDEVNKGFMLLPGLCFDKNHHRMGYGGGFYDKYLSENTQFFKVAAAYDFQVMDSIPYEEYDIPVDKIVTPARVL